MTESEALDMLLDNRAALFPGDQWRIRTGEGRDGLYTFRNATKAEAKLLTLVTKTAGLPGPTAQDVR